MEKIYRWARKKIGRNAVDEPGIQSWAVLCRGDQALRKLTSFVTVGSELH